MRAVDTDLQAEAADRFIEGGAWVSIATILESSWVLESIYRLTPSELAQAIENAVERATVRLFRTKPSLGFTDCLILELARTTQHTPLGTFDRRLAKLNGAQKV